MNLVSCNECGVVLDADKLLFVGSDGFYTDAGEIDNEVAVWNGREYVAKVRCPVCASDIHKHE